MQDPLIATAVQGDDGSERMENLLKFSCADTDSALALYRELLSNVLNNEVASASIDKVKIDGKNIEIFLKIGSLAKLTEIVKIIEEARKRAI